MKIFRPVTIGRLKKMCKYFQGKLIRISWDYYNSVGGEDHRWYIGIYDKFTVEHIGEESIFWVKFYLLGICVFEHEFDGMDEFQSLGLINHNVSGPDCWFRIRNILG